MLFRSLGIPTVTDASLSTDVESGTVVTLDAERGIVYDEALRNRAAERLAERGAERTGR